MDNISTEKTEKFLPPHYTEHIKNRGKVSAVCTLLRYQQWINELSPQESMIRIGYDYACFSHYLQMYKEGKRADNGNLFAYQLLKEKVEAFKSKMSKENFDSFEFGNGWYQAHDNMIELFDDKRIHDYVKSRQDAPFIYAIEQNFEDKSGVNLFSDMEISTIAKQSEETSS